MPGPSSDSEFIKILPNLIGESEVSYLTHINIVDFGYLKVCKGRIYKQKYIKLIMVNQDIVNYLREGQNRGFTIARLKQELVRNNFNPEDVDMAISALRPQALPPVQFQPMQSMNPNPNLFKKKSKTGWIVFLIILILILIGAGVALWFYWDQFIVLFS